MQFRTLSICNSDKNTKGARKLCLMTTRFLKSKDSIHFGEKLTSVSIREMQQRDL